MPLASTFSFPNPVNDKAARLVGGGVLVMALVALLFHQAWLLIPLTYGFLARVAAGPRFSPLGRVAVALAPHISTTRLVPGPPKRFAQAIGALLTVLTSLLTITIGFSAARWLLLPLVVAASLESLAGYCIGCKIFAFLMRKGIVPESVCEACSTLTRPVQPARG